jgi:hypothetical protein
MLILAIVAVILILTLQLGKAARTVPLWVAVLTGLLTLLQLLRELCAAERESRIVGTSDSPAEAAASGLSVRFLRASVAIAGEPEASVRAKELQVLLWLALFALCVDFFGFLVAAPVFMLYAFKIWAGESWMVSVGSALGMLAVVYAFLRLLMPGRLVEGLFWRWVGL